MIYIFTGLSLAFFAFIRIIARYNTVFIEVLFLFLLIFLATFRADSVGSDTVTYASYFVNSPSLLNFDKNYLNFLEFGFRVYLSVIKIFSDSVIFFQFCTSFICLVLLYTGVKKLNIKYSIVALMVYLFIFFIPYPLNVIRQAMVMSIFIFSLSYFYKNNFLAVILLTIFATFIHSTGILILISYIIFKMDYRKIFFFFLILLLFIGFFSYFSFGQYILFSLVGVDSDVYAGTYNQQTGIFQYFYRIILVVLIGFFCFKQNNLELKKIFLIYFFGFLIYILLAKNNMIATRFNMFFRILEVILIPSVLFYIKNNLVRILVFIMFFVLFFCIYFYASFLPENIYSYTREVF